MSRPVIALASVVAGASALVGVLAIEPGVPRWVLVSLLGIIAVGTAVGGVITQTVTVPWKDVEALHRDGKTTAGPASPVPTGREVDVTRTEPSGTL